MKLGYLVVRQLQRMQAAQGPQSIGGDVRQVVRAQVEFVQIPDEERERDEDVQQRMKISAAMSRPTQPELGAELRYDVCVA